MDTTERRIAIAVAAGAVASIFLFRKQLQDAYLFGCAWWNPRALMEHGAKPSGLLGRLVMEKMGAMNVPARDIMIKQTKLRLGESVCELGTADGHGMVAIADGVGEAGTVVGIDPSPDAVEAANERVASCSAAVRALVGAAGSSFGGGVLELPIRSESMDAVVHANCIYFWEDLVGGLRDVHRILKPGGRHVFVCAPESVLKRNHTVNPIFRNVDFAEMTEALKAAGFERVMSGPPDVSDDAKALGWGTTMTTKDLVVFQAWKRA
jgi:SAM-dependent methyltransferase